MTLKEAKRIQEERHGGGMTTEQLAQAVLEAVQAMTSDEKAILRARMRRHFGDIPTSGGKPS